MSSCRLHHSLEVTEVTKRWSEILSAICGFAISMQLL